MGLDINVDPKLAACRKYLMGRVLVERGHLISYGKSNNTKPTEHQPETANKENTPKPPRKRSLSLPEKTCSKSKRMCKEPSRKRTRSLEHPTGKPPLAPRKKRQKISMEG